MKYHISKKHVKRRSDTRRQYHNITLLLVTRHVMHVTWIPTTPHYY